MNRYYKVCQGSPQQAAPCPNPLPRLQLNSADLVVPNMDAWCVAPFPKLRALPPTHPGPPPHRRLMWDFNTLHQVAQEFPSDSPLANQAMYTANAMMNAFDYRDASSVLRARKVAEDVLGKNWEARMEEGRMESGGMGMLGHKQDGRDKNGTLWGVGHCHIDTAWWVIAGRAGSCVLALKCARVQAVAVLRHAAKGRALVVDAGM